MVPLLPPANEVCEGNVFTGVCLSTGGLCPGRFSVQWGGSLSRGVSVREGLCPGVSVQGVVSVRETPYMITSEQ